MPCRLLALIALAPLAAAAQPVAPDTAAAEAATVWTRDGALGFDALPVRSVREVAALSPGLRRDLATGRLTARGGAAGEPVFEVDGVRRLGGVALPFEAVRRVSVLTEGVPARYGQAAEGLVRVETDHDVAEVGGRAEAFSSRATDPYGTDLGALALRAPLGARGGVWLAGELGRQADASAYGVPFVRLTDEAYAELQARPQVVQVTEGGATRFLPFPADAARAALDAGGTFSAADLRAALGLGADAELDSDGDPLPATLALGDDAYERVDAKDDPLDDLRLAGGLAVRPLPGLTLRATGRLDRQRAERSGSPLDVFRASLFARDAVYDVETDGSALALDLDHALSTRLRYRLWAGAERASSVSRPAGFSADVEDALGYTDIDRPAAAVARRIFSEQDGVYEPAFSDGSSVLVAAGTLFGTSGSSGAGFLQPFALAARFDKAEGGTVQAGGSVEARRGRHTFEAGASVERETYRRFTLNGARLAGYVADADGPTFPPSGASEGVQRYDQLAYIDIFRPAYYGYSYNGLVEVDGQDIDAYRAPTSEPAGRGEALDVAPFQPTTAAGYGQADLDFGLARVRLGLRVEAYDAGASVPFDLNTPVFPVLRAGSLGSVPDGIGPDFVVLFNGGDEPTGYRDLDGSAFDAQGQPTIEAVGSFRATDDPLSSVFREVPVHVSVEPRVGVALAVTERVRVVGSYDRLSRRPDPSAHVPFERYIGVQRPLDVSANPFLEPQTVDAVRLAVEADVLPTLAVSVSGVLRKGTVPAYGNQSGVPIDVFTLPRSTTRAVDGQALDLRADWTPSPALGARVHYTLAETTDRGGIASDDVRHALDVVVEGRVPAAFGAVLGGFGGGLALSAQSGLGYTALAPSASETDVTSTIGLGANGAVNAERLPWTHQLDLRLDRPFAVGGAVLEAFVWVENLLDADNVLAAYRATGDPEDDGFLATDPQQIRNLETERERELARFVYQTYVGGPVNTGGAKSTDGAFTYGRPRQIRLGLRATL